MKVYIVTDADKIMGVYLNSEDACDHFDRLARMLGANGAGKTTYRCRAAYWDNDGYVHFIELQRYEVSE